MILRQNAERLLRILAGAQEWPLRRDVKILEDIFKWQWFREADGPNLRGSHPGGWPEDKVYLVDPLASRIAEAFADLQFGEEPDFRAADKADQTRLTELVEETALPSELQQGAEIQVSEGEVWWRARIEKDASDWPIAEFHSRANVVPLFRGPHVIAVAFINVIEEDDNAWRSVQIHAEGIILNRLFEIPLSGQMSQDSIYASSIIPRIYHTGRPFGDSVPLSRRPETEHLPEEWEHNLPMLAGRVINRRGRTYRVGVSQYKRASDLLYSLNEATTIGQSNMRLTARKRVVIDESVLSNTIGPDGEVLAEAPEFDSREEAFVASALDENLESKTGPFKVLEYDFDAAAMIAWDDHLTNKILIRTRTAPALVGIGTEGAATGPALRARLLDSQLAANAKARFWDDGAPVLIRALQQLDALSEGFDRNWKDADEKPAMIRKSIIPEDEKDKTDRHATAMGAEIESRFTALKDMHPSWTDEQIEEEIDRINEDRDAGVPSPGEEEGTRNVDPGSGRRRTNPSGESS